MLIIALGLLPISSVYGKELKLALVPKFYSVFLIKAKMAVSMQRLKSKGLNVYIEDLK